MSCYLWKFLFSIFAPQIIANNSDRERKITAKRWWGHYNGSSQTSSGNTLKMEINWWFFNQWRVSHMQPWPREWGAGFREVLLSPSASLKEKLVPSPLKNSILDSWLQQLSFLPQVIHSLRTILLRGGEGRGWWSHSPLQFWTPRLPIREVRQGTELLSDSSRFSFPRDLSNPTP